MATFTGDVSSISDWLTSLMLDNGWKACHAVNVCRRTKLEKLKFPGQGLGWSSENDYLILADRA